MNHRTLILIGSEFYQSIGIMAGSLLEGLNTSMKRGNEGLILISKAKYTSERVSS